MRAPSLVAGFITLSLLAGFSSAAFAADAGTIQQISGTVTVTDAMNVTRKASVRERIQPGDTIATESRSETLIRMADDSTVVLRPNTRFLLSEFSYNKSPADSSLLKLLRGTARMVTGLIGRRNPANVRVNTPTATIGIRGTDFEVAVVPEDTAEARAGVYDYVHEGETNIKLLAQTGQSLDVKKSQTAYAPDNPKPGEEPLQILRETPIFLRSGGGLDSLIESITIPIPMFR